MEGHVLASGGRWLWSEGWQQQQHHEVEEEEDAVFGPVPRHASPPYVAPLEGDHALSIPSIDEYRMSITEGESEVATWTDTAGGHTSQQEPWLDFLERAQSAEPSATVVLTTSFPAANPRLEDTSGFLERLNDPETQASAFLEPEPEDVLASSSKDASRNSFPPKRPRLDAASSCNRSLGSSDSSQLVSVNCDQPSAHSGKPLGLTAASGVPCASSQQVESRGQTESSTIVNTDGLAHSGSRCADARPDSAAQPSCKELPVDTLQVECGGPGTASSMSPSGQRSGEETKASTDGLLDTAGWDTIQYALILQQHGLIPLAQSFQQMSLQPRRHNPSPVESRAHFSLMEPPPGLSHHLKVHRPSQDSVHAKVQPPGLDPPRDPSRPVSQQSDGPSSAQILKVRKVKTPDHATTTSSLSLRLAQAIGNTKQPTPIAMPGCSLNVRCGPWEPEGAGNLSRPVSRQSDGPSANQFEQVQATMVPDCAAPATSSLSLRRLAQTIRNIKRLTPIAMPGCSPGQHQGSGEQERRRDPSRPVSQHSYGPSAAQVAKVRKLTTPPHAAPASSSLSLRLAQTIQNIKRPTPGCSSDQHQRPGEPERRGVAVERSRETSTLWRGATPPPSFQGVRLVADLADSFRPMPGFLHDSATLGTASRKGPNLDTVHPHAFPNELLGKQGADTNALNSTQLLSPASAASLRLLAGSGRGMERGVMQRLQMAAQAVEDGKLDVFNSIAESLRWLVQPTGDALGRLTAMMLKALFLRIRGEATKYTFQKPKHFTQQAVVEGRQWLFAATPFVQWLCAYAGSMILPHLRGHREVLLLLWSDTMVLSLPALMQALATGSGHMVVGPLARLEHIRVTVIDHNDLVFPGRNDFVNVRAWGIVQSQLEREAAALGIKLEFTVLLLNVHNLDVLDNIERKAGEGFAFCGTSPFNKSSEDPSIGNGSRLRVMQAVQRLRPNVVCVVEEDLDGTLGNMPQRFRACMEHYEAGLRANDACSGIHRRKRVCTFERGFCCNNTYRIVGCEGQDRMVRPLSRAQWDKWFALFGLEALPVDPAVADTLDRLLTRFPQGFSSQPDDHWLCLCWDGVPISVGSCWVPSI